MKLSPVLWEIERQNSFTIESWAKPGGKEW